jgi:hypothetical protein
MQRVSVRTRFLVVALVVVLGQSAQLIGADLPVRHLHLSVAQLREPGQPPTARRPPSLIRRFITWALGEIDIPHP